MEINEKKLNTTFIISGGAGRVVTVIPALEKYHRLNPDDNFKVLIHGWEMLFWSHPILQEKTFSISQKGTFKSYIKNNKVIHPEPYYNYRYYNQKISLAEAFDEEINNTTDHTDLSPPILYVSSLERTVAKKLIFEKKKELKKNKVIVIQPYGSGMSIINDRPYDSSHRSMDVDQYLSLIKKISNDALIVYFGPQEFKHPGDNISLDLSRLSPNLRTYMAFIEQCDYFVGCDSVGQHMARALNKPGLIIMGSTSEINVSYPNYFTIYRNGIEPEYSPIRLIGVDCEFADRINDGIMNFTDKQLNEIAKIINLKISGK